MTIREAEDWLEGNRSMGNMIPANDFDTWQVRVAQADAAMMQQAYYIVKAAREKEGAKEISNDN